MSTQAELEQKAWETEKGMHPPLDKKYYVRLTLEESNAITPSPVNFKSELIEELIMVFALEEFARAAYFGTKPILEASAGAK